MNDPRAAAAAYYDFATQKTDDIPFYIAHLPGADASVLELGCGTGRVTIPLSMHCRFVHGLDHSEAMIRGCEAKLAAAQIPTSKVTVQLADVTEYSLGRRFDRVIAPFRMLQNLATDNAVDGFFQRIAAHLEADGVAVVSAFNPNRTRDEMVAHWTVPAEELEWEAPDGTDTVRCFVRRARFTTEPLVLYPDIIYRRVRAGRVVDEVVLSVPMRCYYPEELVQLVERHGFEIADTWGGYAGEAYGSGNELVVAMRRGV